MSDSREFTENEKAFIEKIVYEATPLIIERHIAACPYGKKMMRVVWLTPWKKEPEIPSAIVKDLDAERESLRKIQELQKVFQDARTLVDVQFTNDVRKALHTAIRLHNATFRRRP